jgi:hypothetical protein
MSRKGEKTKKSINDLLDQFKDKEGLEPFVNVLKVLDDLNMRLQEIEHSLGTSDDFVDLNDASHQITRG